MKRMADFYTPGSESKTVDASLRTLLPIVVVGAFVGVLSYGLALLIAEVIINPLFCQEDPIALCGNVATISGNIALVFASIVGLAGLVRVGSYRALLIVLASIATLWGFSGWISGMTWFAALLLSVILFSVTYAALAWLARINNFLVALSLIAVTIILARVLPVI